MRKGGIMRKGGVMRKDGVMQVPLPDISFIRLPETSEMQPHELSVVRDFYHVSFYETSTQILQEKAILLHQTKFK